MDRKRLLILANHLRTVRPETFDIGTWKCGTTACAVGHACAIPELQKAGLSLNLLGWSFPTFEDLEGWDAVCKFFDIPFDAAEYLFAGEFYGGIADSREVSDRILGFIK